VCGGEQPVDPTCVGLADRDWYREESSEAFWRELNRSIGGRSRSRTRAPRAGLGLLAALVVSLALLVLANHTGVLRPPRYGSGVARSASPPRQLLAPAPLSKRIILGTQPGFDVVGTAGRHWCITVSSGRRYCARTESSESGRDALTRVLRLHGYTVVNALPTPSIPS